MLEAIDLRALLAGGAEIDSVCSASMGPNNSKRPPSVATAPAAMCHVRHVAHHRRPSQSGMAAEPQRSSLAGLPLNRKDPTLNGTAAETQRSYLAGCPLNRRDSIYLADWPLKRHHRWKRHHRCEVRTNSPWRASLAKMLCSGTPLYISF